MLIFNDLYERLEKEKIGFSIKNPVVSGGILYFKKVPIADLVSLHLEAFSHKKALFDRIVCLLCT